MRKFIYVVFASVLSINMAFGLDESKLISECENGDEQSCKELLIFYTNLCNKNDAGSCNNLGVLYDNGQGIRQNKNVAKDYYGKACDLGEQLGCDKYRKLNEQGY